MQPTFQPLPSSPSRRWCIRCTDCLAVAFVETAPSVRPPHADCDACDGVGTVETMGEVRGVHVGHDETRCACDGRCTHAKGPDCECSCGGVNHGTGATVTLFVIDGKAPRARMPNTPAATAVAVEWRAILRAADEARTTLPQWASGARYRLARHVSAAKAMRQHKARMARMRKAIGECAATAAKCAGGAS